MSELENKDFANEIEQVLAAGEALNLKVFIDICDKLKLPVFEAQADYIGLLAVMARRPPECNNRIFPNMTAYYESLPYSVGCDIDYETGEVVKWDELPDIANGDFWIKSDNDMFNFKVFKRCVLVQRETCYIG